MKKILIIAAAVLAFAGCAKEAAQVERVTIDGKEYMTFKVVAHDDVVSADTKATLSRGGVFGWEDGDPIYFVAAGGTMATGSYNASAGTITVESGEWFCASTAPFDSDSKIKDFGLAKGPVVWAKVNGSTLHFYHIGSVINLKFDNIPIDGYLEFWPNNDEEKWAGGNFHFFSSGEPELDTDETDAIYIKRPITTADAGKDISLTVPNRQYFNGFTVALSGTSAKYFEKSTSTKYELGTLPTLLNMQEVSVTLSTYTIAGAVDKEEPATAGIFGTAWDVSNTDNDMLLSPDGYYKKTYTSVPNWITFKVVEDHAWTNNWGKDGEGNIVKNGGDDDNFERGITKVGGGVTISFSPIAPDIIVNEFDIAYTIAGADRLCTSSWDPTDASNDMSEVDDGVYYKKYAGVPAGDYEFKVAANHNWNQSWGQPTNQGNNFFLHLDTAKDVEIYFYSANHYIRIVGINDNYFVAGSESEIFNGESWNESAAVNKLEIQNNGIYSKDFKVCDRIKNWATDYTVEFKVTNGTWDVSWPGSNAKFNGKGKDDFTIFFNPITETVTAVGVDLY